MKQAQRIQKSITNDIERHILIWLAKHQPRWVSSDLMTAVGMLGALIVAIGFVLSNLNVGWLWLCSTGLVINWYGDSLDGTLARVRNNQRPIYGYYLDHTVDCINEGLMFVGAGLSPFLHLDLTLVAFALYLQLTINVSINAHLKGEFRLTYIKLGPTEFRLIVILLNTLLVAWPELGAKTDAITLGSYSFTLKWLDYVGLAVVLILGVIYFATIITDARKYAIVDPPKYNWDEKK